MIVLRSPEIFVNVSYLEKECMNLNKYPSSAYLSLNTGDPREVRAPFLQSLCCNLMYRRQADKQANKGYVSCWGLLESQGHHGPEVRSIWAWLWWPLSQEVLLELWALGWVKLTKGKSPFSKVYYFFPFLLLSTKWGFACRCPKAWGP
jgi:hypothetical protein